MMELLLNDLAVDCIIGERADERNRAQRLRVDVVLKVEGKADETDDLADTVDYAALADRIRSALVEAKCKMIERAARIVYELCLEEKRVASAEVAVTKAGAVAGLGSATVKYRG